MGVASQRPVFFTRLRFVLCHFRALSFRSRVFHFFSRNVFVFGEILAEKSGEFLGGGVKRGFVFPEIFRNQNLARNIGTNRRNV